MSKPKPDDPAQSKRFLSLAKELEADSASGAMKNLDAAIKRLAEQPPEPRRKLGKKAKGG